MDANKLVQNWTVNRPFVEISKLKKSVSLQVLALSLKFYAKELSSLILHA